MNAVPSADTPAPRTPLILLAELGGAAVGVLLLAVLLYFGAGWLLLALAPGAGMGILVLQIYAVLLGANFGAAAGVWLVGRQFRQGGNFWLALLFTVGGAILTALLPRLGVIRLGIFETLYVALAIITVAAVAGYNLRRH